MVSSHHRKQKCINHWPLSMNNIIQCFITACMEGTNNLSFSIAFNTNNLISTLLTVIYWFLGLATLHYFLQLAQITIFLFFSFYLRLRGSLGVISVCNLFWWPSVRGWFKFPWGVLLLRPWNRSAWLRWSRLQGMKRLWRVGLSISWLLTHFRVATWGYRLVLCVPTAARGRVVALSKVCGGSRVLLFCLLLSYLWTGNICVNQTTLKWSPLI